MKFTPEMFSDLARTAKDPEAASKAAGLLNGTIDPETVPETEAWVRQCYHCPRAKELILHAVNAVLDLYGVEAIDVEEAYVDSYHGGIIASYCNTGDTYAQTVLLDSETQEFMLTSWGDFLESWEAEHAEEEEEEEEEEDENSADDLDGDDPGIFPED